MVSAGAPREGLHLLQKGRAVQFDSNGTRLFEFSPGDAIEPRGAFDTSMAVHATIAVEPCRTLVLTPDSRVRLEERRPRSLLDLYKYVFTTEAGSALDASA